MCELTLSEAGIILTEYVSVTVMKENYRVGSIADIPSFTARSFQSRPRLKVVLRNPDVRIPMPEQRALSQEIYDKLHRHLGEPQAHSPRVRDNLAYDLHRQLSKVYKALNGSNAYVGVLGSTSMFQYATMELTPLIKVHMKRDRGIFELQLTDDTANGYWTNGVESGLFSLSISEDTFSVSRIDDQLSVTEELREAFAIRWPIMPEVSFTFLDVETVRGLRDSIDAITNWTEATVE